MKSGDVPANVPATIETVAEFDRALQPARVYRLVTGRDPNTGARLKDALPADDEQLVRMFQQARSLNQNSWLAMAIVCGEAVSRVGEDRLGFRRLARALECHKSEVVRLVRVYREIIKPRIERDGDGATFPVTQMVYYTLACEAAAQSPEKSATALELFERAEIARDGERRFTSREFRETLISEGYLKRGPSALEDGAARALEALRVLSEIPDDVVERVGAVALDVATEVRRQIEDARAVLSGIERALAAEEEEQRRAFDLPERAA